MTVPSRTALAISQRLRKLLFASTALVTLGVGALPCYAAPALSKPSAAPSRTSIITTDAVIYGATPGGIAAAIALRREGLSVTILEPSEHIGGMTTSGLGGADICAHMYIGGLARRFFEKVGQHYNQKLGFRFEPHIAARIFSEMLRDHQVKVLTGTRLVMAQVGDTQSAGRRVLEVKSESGIIYRGKYFVDATYEGDLLALSGVSFAVGREGREKYGEPLAGFITTAIPKHHDWATPVNPYKADGSLVPHILPDPKSAPGAGDSKVPAFNFRIIVTDNPENRVPFTRPEKYDEGEFELLARYLEANPSILISDLLTILNIPAGKMDINNKGPFSTNLVGGNYRWIEGDTSTRREIWLEHKRYTQALLYFLTSSPRVPRQVRDVMSTWGYAKDEFVSSNNWPPQLYVRVGRRLLGEYVMTTHDTVENRLKPDPVAIASCPLESHHVQRIAVEGRAVNEGYVRGETLPYHIPLRSLLPRRDEAENLIVPVSISASHLAFSSLRMEPVFMIMGESAGIAISIANKQGQALHDIDPKKLQKSLISRKQRITLRKR